MTYEEEYQDTLDRIYADNEGLQNLPYFMSVAAEWHARFADDREAGARAGRYPAPSVVVLGHGIPEQLIYACGATPYFLMGGSLASCKWSDDAVPRDSDPVSRSILGYATKLAQADGPSPLYVVPVVNDNLRKIAYLLEREGHEVVPVNVPPVGDSVSAQRAWESSLECMVKAIVRRVRGRITPRSIRYADWLVGDARAALVGFEQARAQCEGVLSDEAGLLVQNTYYQTANLRQWSEMVRRLTAELRMRHHAMGQSASRAPRVLVVGSPIVFPQYKVPELIHDAGLSLLAAVDASSTARYANLDERERRGGTSHLIKAIARKQYSLDSSSAHVVNHAMEQYVEYLLESGEVDGVVCHILKGQIEYDFELTRLESLLDQHDIPVFRLETDYQYQDVEQLRIRLEAFAEMLEQRAYVANQAYARRCA